VLLVDAVYSVAVGVLFLAGTWDGLWDALDLPQGQPAVFVQIGGALLWGIAYLLWLAARTPSLMVPVARASALMNALTAVVIVVWLIAGELDIDTLGTVLLIAAAALSAAFTVLYLMASIRPGGYGPEPPPAPG
jgi:predicted neutral ceramidase superfamily lipid hydrolase